MNPIKSFNWGYQPLTQEQEKQDLERSGMHLRQAQAIVYRIQLSDNSQELIEEQEQ